MARILLKTTIPTVEDDWHIGRFSLLGEHLAGLKAADGGPRHQVTARDRQGEAQGDDPDFAALAAGEWDQLWLLAVDVTGALTDTDVANIAAFQAAGGGVLTSRDHQDLGACITRLGAVGQCQHFQTQNPEADPARHRIDDTGTPHITWPNYHSGRNGDFQAITPLVSGHPLLMRADGHMIHYLPSHPHEGAVDAPAGLSRAVAVARGRSLTTHAPFNLMVAVEREGAGGRAVADSSFHHFSDCNWDPALGAPSFVDEPWGDGMVTNAVAASDARRYAENIADWLAA
ncbi:MAG: hypothetical protein JWP35_3573 [Caulobacter sp.]|nr:hypothetical protein [Caulobacter sp.]